MTRLYLTIGGLSLILSLIAALALTQRWAGGDAARGDAAQDTLQAIEDGTDAANNEARDTRDLGDNAIRDRLRDRDW